MRSSKLTAGLAMLALCGVAAAQTVSVALDSSQQGQTVAPGATIDWQITFTVSSGDNAGLALLVCDLVQDDANPATIDIPPADAVPAGMSNFSRPAGISNPGEGGADSGYVGVQRGSAGAMNLVQIGGGQNTFGQALPSGTGLGENADVVGGVGQGGPVVLASGSLVAPAACGNYTFSLANIVANVLTEVNAPPAFSPVVQAAVDSSAATLSFSVGLAGDLDGDGDVDLADLAVLLANYNTPSGMTYADGDLDGDGDVDLSDLAIMLANYGGSC